MFVLSFQALLEQLIRRRSDVNTSEENGRWLTENCPDDRNMRPDVRTALSHVYTPLDTIEARLNERKSKLQSAVMRGQEFDKSFTDLMDRINTLEFQVKRQKPVSALWESVTKQQKEQKVIVKELVTVKSVMNQLLVISEKVIESLEPGTERDDTIQKIEDIKQQWGELVERVHRRDDVIDDVEPSARVFRDETVKLVEWIAEPEQFLKTLEQVPTTREELIDFKKAVKEFRVEVQNHTPKYAEFMDSYEKLAFVCHQYPNEVVNLPDVEETTRKLNDRWGKLEIYMQASAEKVDKLQAVLVTYYDDCLKSDRFLKEIEKALEYQPSYGVDSEAGRRELERIDELIQVGEQAREWVDRTNEDSNMFEQTIDVCGGDDSNVKEKTKELTNRLREVNEQLHSRRADVERTNKILLQFNSSVEEIEHWYITMTQMLVSVGSVKHTSEQVKEQLHVVNVSIPFHQA